MTTHALYAHPKDMVDPKGTAKKLAAIFPELDAAALERRFTDGRSFVWIRKVLSPEQVQKVHEIGDPGLLFGPREMRLYPNGTLAAHVLGGYSFGAEGVHSASYRHRPDSARVASRSSSMCRGAHRVRSPPHPGPPR